MRLYRVNGFVMLINISSIASRRRQQGVTMFVTIILVLVILVVALAVFQYDRQLATQAAELALRDAELDLACLQMPALSNPNSTPVYCTGNTDLARQPVPATSPPAKCRVTCGVPGGPKKSQLMGFNRPPNDAAHAGRWAGTTASPGIAASGSSPAVPPVVADSPVTVRSNWSDSSGNVKSAVLGQFTGTSPVPNVARQPRYMIEGWDHDGSGPEAPTFRITAKAWGRNSNTEITLQQVYRP